MAARISIDDRFQPRHGSIIVVVAIRSYWRSPELPIAVNGVLPLLPHEQHIRVRNVANSERNLLQSIKNRRDF
jgi:hypothetical protein